MHDIKQKQLVNTFTNLTEQFHFVVTQLIIPTLFLNLHFTLCLVFNVFINKKYLYLSLKVSRSLFSALFLCTTAQPGASPLPHSPFAHLFALQLLITYHHSCMQTHKQKLCFDTISFNWYYIMSYLSLHITKLYGIWQYSVFISCQNYRTNLSDTLLKYGLNYKFNNSSNCQYF